MTKLRRNSAAEWWFTAATLLVLAVALGFMLSERASCHDHGGTYVRGVIWFECIRDE